MPAKYLNIVALSVIAFLACSFSPTPVAALSIDSHGLLARHAHLGQTFAKRAPKRCKVRSPPAAGDSTVSPAPPATTPANPSPNTPAPPANTPVPQAPANNNGGKAGLAFEVFDGGAQEVLTNFHTNKVSSIYNWQMNKVTVPGASDYDFIPLVSRADNVWQIKDTLVYDYAHHVLGFNEPNLASQANLDPGYAATLWRQHFLPLRNLGYQLISPATTSAPTGINWMESFLGACGADCVDKIALHWYGTDPQEFIRYLQLWHDRFGKNIWVTEFACMDFATYVRCPDVMGFAATVTAFMDNTPWVERYFPFMVARSLGNVDGVNTLLAGNSRNALADIYFTYH